MTLLTRLIAAVAAAMVLIILAGGVLSYWQGKRWVVEETGAAMASARATIDTALRDMLRVADPKRELTRLVHSFDNSRHLRVSLVQADGSVEASVRHPLRSRIPDWFFRVLEPQKTVEQIALPAEFAPAQSLRLETEPRSEIEEVWDETALDARILAALLALLLAAISMLLKTALAPLPGLLGAFARVGEGDYAARTPVTGSREFRGLSTAFNDMVERLVAAERDNRRLAEQLASARETERAEIARDLHDGIGPLLFAIDVDAMNIAETATAASADVDACRRAASIRQSVAETKSHVGALLGRLRPDVALDLGLVHAVEQLVGACRPRHPDLVLTSDIPPGSWGPSIDAMLYYVIREGLHNALRHAGARRISILVGYEGDGGLRVAVSDDGKGLQPGAQSSGYGLVGMRERLQEFGGRLDLSTGPGGRGLVVSGHVPRASLPANTAKQLSGAASG
ncbi:MAG: ATP-binding protein [Hyphomicrobium sp.]